MRLVSCSNCCFNPLQYDVLGLSAGYCVEHRKVLRAADHTTCGRLYRKDLPNPSAEVENEAHRRSFDPDRIAWVASAEPVAEGDERLADADPTLSRDPVGKAASEYGLLDTKIGVLASLRHGAGVRPEIGRLSLGRTYARRCVGNGGRWTSAVHMVRWTQERLAEPPRVEASDYRLQSSVAPERQEDLAAWSMLMLRVLLLADVGGFAGRTGHALGALATWPDEAAEAAETSGKKLLRWITKHAAPALDRLLPEATYVAIANEARSDYRMGVADAD